MRIYTLQGAEDFLNKKFNDGLEENVFQVNISREYGENPGYQVSIKNNATGVEKFKKINGQPTDIIYNMNTSQDEFMFTKAEIDSDSECPSVQVIFDYSLYLGLAHILNCTISEATELQYRDKYPDLWKFRPANLDNPGMEDFSFFSDEFTNSKEYWERFTSKFLSLLVNSDFEFSDIDGENTYLESRINVKMNNQLEIIDVSYSVINDKDIDVICYSPPVEDFEKIGINEIDEFTNLFNKFIADNKLITLNNAKALQEMEESNGAVKRIANKKGLSKVM